MENINQENLRIAYNEVSLIIKKCENIHNKFKEGSSQHTLLRNRIKSMHISKCILENKNVYDYYSQKELEDALKPIISIIHKCAKAQEKYDVNTKQYNRYINMLSSMTLCKCIIEECINKKSLNMIRDLV